MRMCCGTCHECGWRYCSRPERPDVCERCGLDLLADPCPRCGVDMQTGLLPNGEPVTIPMGA